MLEFFQQLWFVGNAVFLFGAIQLHHIDDTGCRKLLIAGFGLSTLTGILGFTEYLEIIITSYSPYAEHNDFSGNSITIWAPWEKWYFWFKAIAGNAGLLVTSIGLIGESKHLLRESHKSRHQRIQSS